MSHLYRLYDADPKGCILVEDLEEAKLYNQTGWGIYRTVNEFDGPRRKENLVRVAEFALDLDTGSKHEQFEIIMSGLVPSYVIESKRGFQPHFKLIDGDAKYWNSIMLDRLLPFYGADNKARDLCRVLREPGFLHWKDLENPYMVTKVYESDTKYTLAQFDYYYPENALVQEQKRKFHESKDHKESDDIWESIWNIDCLEALPLLSGMPELGYEHFSFRRNESGTHQILVNKKPHSSWVDVSGRIGSYDHGGPTIYNWIKWYKVSSKRAIEIIREKIWNKSDTNSIS